MEWIDFKPEPHGEPEGVDKPLVTSWWGGSGFAGRCPRCGHRVLFTTLGMEALRDDQAVGVPTLPPCWHAVAQFG